MSEFAKVGTKLVKGKAITALCAAALCLMALGGCAQPEQNGAPVEEEAAESAGEANQQPEAQEAPTASDNGMPQGALVTPEELAAQLKEDPSATLIDVRAPYAYQQSHIAEAINIPAGSQLEVRIGEVPQEGQIYLIDSSGQRAAEAWQTLVDYGFDPSKVHVVEGGMERWSKEGRPTRAGEPRHC